MKGKITFTDEMGEHDMMEWLLNMHHSGYCVHITLGMYAFFKGWHINKLVYYNNLLEEKCH